MTNTLQAWTEALRMVAKPKGILVVGSGNGSTLKPLLSWDVENVVLVEGDSAQIAKMRKAFVLPESWRVLDAVVGNCENIAFHRANNPTHSGTVSPELLGALWPNLVTIDSEMVASVTADRLVEDYGLLPINWLFIECFPVLDIARSAEKLLEMCDVVALRAVADGYAQEANSSISMVEEWFEKCGFGLVGRVETEHPQVVNLVFVRNYRKQIETLQAERDAACKEKEELSTQAQELQEQTVQLENKAKESEQKLADQAKANETLQAERDAARKEKEELLKAKAALENEKKVLIDKQRALEEKVDILSDAKIEQLVDECSKAEDIFEVLDAYMLGDVLSDDKKFDLACSVAQRLGTTSDRMQGVGLLNQARLFVSTQNLVAVKQYEKLSHLATLLNQPDLAVDFLMDSMALEGTTYHKKIISGYTKIRSTSRKAQQHGHDLLIDYINKNIPKDEMVQKLLIEIGTTRENVPGQGSTEQLAKLCKEKNIRFITVDMDPHNTRWANFVSKKKNLGFEAITAKGEEYLKNDANRFDFIFLDAYDFDHGMHSELRQTRYEKNLGSKIDETECHIMHLKCAYSVEEKLKEGGIVCIDDTWQDENGNWTAKGTLAVPHLLNRGFQIIEARNRAVLMRRGGLWINK